MGRPSMYETEVQGKLEAVKAWAQSGLTDDEIADKLGIHRASLYRYKAKYKDFSDALKKGKDVADSEVVNALRKRALGFWVTEEITETTETNGLKTVKVRQQKRYVPPDVGAAAFWLKNRNPTEWRERREVSTELSTDGSVTFNVTAASKRKPESEERED